MGGEIFPIGKKNKNILFFLGDFRSQGFGKTNSEKPPDFYITFAVAIFCTLYDDKKFGNFFSPKT
jgi:hypothetical protein